MLRFSIWGNSARTSLLGVRFFLFRDVVLPVFFVFLFFVLIELLFLLGVLFVFLLLFGSFFMGWGGAGGLVYRGDGGEKAVVVLVEVVVGEVG